MNATCKGCGGRTATTYKVDTDVGPVTVTVCTVCDRARCGACRKHVPGNARSCPACGNAIPMLASG